MCYDNNKEDERYHDWCGDGETSLLTALDCR